MEKVNFTVHAPINSGMGTAFMGSMSHGLIPVGYVDLPPHEECSVTTEKWDVDSITECIAKASRKSTEWCETASIRVISLYDEICGIRSLRVKLEEAFSIGHITKIRGRSARASDIGRKLIP